MPIRLCNPAAVTTCPAVQAGPADDQTERLSDEFNQRGQINQFVFASSPKLQLRFPGGLQVLRLRQADLTEFAGFGDLYQSAEFRDCRSWAPLPSGPKSADLFCFENQI